MRVSSRSKMMVFLSMIEEGCTGILWFLGEVQGLLEEFFGVDADEFHFLKVLDEGEGFV